MDNQTPLSEIEEIHTEIIESMQPIEMPSWIEFLLRKAEAFFSKIGETLGSFFLKIIEPLKPFLKAIGNFLVVVIGAFLSLPPVLIVFVCLVLTAGLVFLILLIIKKSHKKYSIKKEQQGILKTAKKNVALSPSQAIYLDALADSKKKNYQSAILTLHKGSVLYLREQKRLHNYRDYTNREIARELDKEKNPFTILANKAEEILFGERRVTESDFIKMKEIYRENFYA